MQLFSASLTVCCQGFLKWSLGYQFFLPQICSPPSCQNDLSSVQIYPCKSPAELSPNSRVQPHLPCCSSPHAVAVSIVMCCGSWTYHNIPHLYSFAYDFHSAPEPPYPFMSVCHLLIHLMCHFLEEAVSSPFHFPLHPQGVYTPLLCAFLAPTA